MTRTRRDELLLLAAVVLISLNLRAAITVVGPLIGDIKDANGLSGTAVGVLTGVPLLAFGFVSPFAPRLAARWGIERTLVGCLLVLTAALLVRVVPSVVLLFAGTVVACGGIAVANVLVPALLKRRFADRATLATGVYSVALGIGAALAAGLAVPSEDLFGGSWRAALAVWSALALLSALVWLPQTRGAGVHGAAAARAPVSLWRDRIAWFVTGFMALQALQFYSTASWLPEIYRHEGMTKAHAGALLSLLLTVGIPLGFIVAAAAGRLHDQRPIAVAGVAIQLVGWIGLLLAPTTVPALWAVLLGVGFAAGFTLVLALIVLRAPDTRHAAALSGMTQSVGYAVAALGPIAIGALHDLTGGWTIPLLLLTGCTLAQTVFGLGGGKPGFVRGCGADEHLPEVEPIPAAAGPAH